MAEHGEDHTQKVDFQAGKKKKTDKVVCNQIYGKYLAIIFIYQLEVYALKTKLIKILKH